MRDWPRNTYHRLVMGHFVCRRRGHTRQIFHPKHTHPLLWHRRDWGCRRRGHTLLIWKTHSIPIISFICTQYWQSKYCIWTHVLAIVSVHCESQNEQPYRRLVMETCICKPFVSSVARKWQQCHTRTWPDWMTHIWLKIGN